MNIFSILVIFLSCITIGLLLWQAYRLQRQDKDNIRDQGNFQQQFGELKQRILLFGEQSQALNQQQIKLQHQGQLDNIKLLQDNLQHLQQQLLQLLNQRIDLQSQQISQLTTSVDNRLKEISGQVEKRLQEGFEKTTATFTDVVKRLALIDEAQKKITALSENVVGLQEVLLDKRARGAFGEVQLAGLVGDMIPTQHFALQHTLSNGKRCDCILFLPPPTGSIVIDAKFPLEAYQKLRNHELADEERKAAEKQFRIDIKVHIKAISQKYILPEETAHGAIMFIPSEAVFAEIHSAYPELVQEAQQSSVWLTSPTTLMAVLTTAKAVLKDSAMRQQVNLVQKHLQDLAKDFERFQKRMDNLSTHISQAHKDVQEVHISASKITDRFIKIDQVELALLED